MKGSRNPGATSDQSSSAALVRQHAEQQAIPSYRYVPTSRPNVEEYESVGQPLTDGDVRPECDVLQRIVLRKTREREQPKIGDGVTSPSGKQITAEWHPDHDDIK
jgi:hypothetical protein